MSKQNKYSLILWGLSWSIIALSATPIMAEEIETKVASLPESNPTSTKASDLLLPRAGLSKYFTDIQTRTYQLGQLNIEKFCQDYPYNSKCKDIDSTSPESDLPEVETEPDSIPVPVPPPTRSRGTESRATKKKSGWAIVPEISTLGLGGHVVRKVIPQINARAGINTFSLDLDGAIDTDVDYEANLNLFNVSALADIHPFKSSGFRISTGLVFSNNSFEGSGDVSSLVVDELENQLGSEGSLSEESVDALRDINDLATIDADIDITNSISPYLGIGGGNAVGKGKGFGFWWNLGVILSGMPQIDLEAEIADDRIRDEIEPEFEDEVDRVLTETREATDEVIDEQEDEIQDVLDFVNIYPVLSLGISYQF